MEFFPKPPELGDPEPCSLQEYNQGKVHRIHPANLAPNEKYTLRALLDRRVHPRHALNYETVVVDKTPDGSQGAFIVSVLVKKREVEQKKLSFNREGFIVSNDVDPPEEVAYFASDSDMVDLNDELVQLLEVTKPPEPALA